MCYSSYLSLFVAVILQKKTAEVLNMIVNYFKSLEHDVQLTVQLQHDIEQEQIKKVSNYLAKRGYIL